eukprot:CAMPEP_0173199864 /NCGR_PEP_ID=MMETSP1141-20130122/17471_1 /TAXON_ID=483371 /ORGANISM="non described non described, Strain CCMP2298" /LENGTH=89 /DNA_ID=CAMNT_0014124799 /DNA_START=678 /DNA_END=947 /DNA_ORIENTATION=-
MASVTAAHVFFLNVCVRTPVTSATQTTFREQKKAVLLAVLSSMPKDCPMYPTKTQSPTAIPLRTRPHSSLEPIRKGAVTIAARENRQAT